MTVKDIVVIAVIALAIAGAVWKIVRDKRKGIACSGCSCCPSASSCAHPSDKNH